MGLTDGFDFQKLLDAAENHGRESDPDHEVGDLRIIIEVCFDQMFPDQKQRVFEDAFVQEILEWGP